MALAALETGKLIFDVVTEISKGAASVATIIDDVWKGRHLPPIIRDLQNNWHDLTELAEKCLANADFFTPDALDALLKKTVMVGDATERSIRQCSNHGYIVLHVKFIGTRCTDDVRYAYAVLEWLQDLKGELRSRSDKAVLNHLRAHSTLLDQKFRRDGESNSYSKGFCELPVPEGYGAPGTLEKSNADAVQLLRREKE